MTAESRLLVLRPAVGMQHVVAVPHVVALALCETTPGSSIAWPHRLVRECGDSLCDLGTHAGYDEDGMFVRVETSVGLGPEVVAHVEERVSSWAASLVGRPALGPLAPVLADYANHLAQLGTTVQVTFPNGSPLATGTFVGVDVWGRATVRLGDGRELEFSPEKYLIR